MQKPLKEKLLILFCLIFFVILTLPNLLAQNLIGDEAVYILEGDKYLHTWETFYNNSGSPAFLKLLSGIMYAWLPLNRNYSPYFEDITTNVYRAANFTYIQNAQYAKLIIILARIPHFIISIALALAVYTFTKKLYNKSTALIALFFYCLHPLILAHSATANLDLGLTAFTFFCIATWYYYLKSNNILNYKHLILIGVLLGITQTTKISAILLYPYFFITYLFFAKQKRLNELPLIFFISIFTILTIYRFQIGPILLPKEDPAGLFSALNIIPFIKQNEDKLIPILRSPLFPLGAFINNFTYQLTHSFYGHTTYLLGTFTDKGIWYLTSVLFLFKNSIILLLLFALKIGEYIKNRKIQSKEIYLLFWVVLIIVWSMTTRLQLGVRYIMPILPVFLILSASMLYTLFKQRKNKQITLIPLALYMISTLSVAPEFFTYRMELIRTIDPVDIMYDSDYDWGQNVYRVAQIQKKQNLYPLYLKSSGGANHQFEGIQTEDSPEQAFTQQKSGYYAFSHTMLVDLKRTDPLVFNFFKNRQKTQIIGNNIYIYYVTF